MQITLEQLAKRFQRDWIFKDLDFEFEENNFYAVVGSNGSGKSTLIKLISGIELPSKGVINYSLDDKKLAPDSFYKHMSYAAPYQELVEEFTLAELIDFHFSVRMIEDGFTKEALPEIWNLKGNENKYISNFSSGMKQRVRLGLAFYSKKKCLLLDEPTVNLDKEGVEWFHKQLSLFKENTLVIMASNEPAEYKACDAVLEINQFK